MKLLEINVFDINFELYQEITYTLLFCMDLFHTKKQILFGCNSVIYEKMFWLFLFFIIIIFKYF